MIQAFGVGEAERALRGLHHDALGLQPASPERERVDRADPPLDAVHHAGAGVAGDRVRILEESDVRAGLPGLV